MATSRRHLLRERDFAALTGSIGLSALGDWLATLALMLQIKEITGSGLAVSALLICLWAPSLVLAGHVGLLVDRFETTRLLGLVSLGQAVIAGVLAFVDSSASILVLTVFLGVGFAVSQAAEFALVPAIAGTDRTREANGYVETARYAGFTVGPVCGGALTAAGGTEIAMLLNAATFVAVAAVAFSLRARRAPERRSDIVGPRARDGVVKLFGDRLLAIGMAVAFVALLFMSASIPADVFFAQDVLGVGDIAFTIVYTAWTLGMILGAVVVAKRIPHGAVALALAASAAVTVQGLGKAVPPFFLVYAVMLAGYFVGGLGHGVKNVAFRTLIHERVDPGAHGRAFAAYNGLRNGAELAALVAGGVLVNVAGPRTTLWIAGGVSALAGVVGLGLLRRPAERPTAADAAAET
jgi:MFS family permease